MNTASQIVSTLKLWNASQPEKRRSLMNDFRGIRPITSLELRIKAKQAMSDLLDLEVYAMFLTLDAQELLK